MSTQLFRKARKTTLIAVIFWMSCLFYTNAGSSPLNNMSLTLDSFIQNFNKKSINYRGETLHLDDYELFASSREGFFVATVDLGENVIFSFENRIKNNVIDNMSIIFIDFEVGVDDIKLIREISGLLSLDENIIDKLMSAKITKNNCKEKLTNNNGVSYNVCKVNYYGMDATVFTVACN